ncbi:30S ribosomal protein S9 [Candidatus Omnitrophota bacterium]
MGLYYGTGKRKNAIARVWLSEGQGDLSVNSKTIKNYFLRENLCMIVKQPLETTNTLGRFNLKARVAGGGLTGQAEALRHGIAKALVEFDETLRSALRQEGFLTRDPRMKERKKYGQKKARKAFQFTKR